MSDWRITTLGQEVDLLTGNPFKSAQYTDDKGDVLLLRGDNIGQGFLRWENAKRWSIEKTEGIEDYFLQEDDVVLAMDRPWIEAGLKFAYLSQNDLPCLLVQRVSRLRAKEKLNQTFLRYVIQSYEFTQYIIKTQTGTAVPHISGTQIKDFEFLIPPLSEQEEIAKTLGILDRKIENLRSQNETLERIAQTLFKHWFVDFEFPNEDGKPYKSSGGEMVRSELGEIPADWKVGTSGDLIYLQGGFAFKSKDFKDSGNHRILKIKNISGNVVDIQQTDFIADSTAKGVDSKFKVKSGDVLIAMTGAEVAKMGLVPTTNEAIWLNQRVGLFREIIPGARVFIYCLFTRESHQQLLRDRGSGSSAQPNISGNDIESIPLVKPLQSVLAIFAEVVEPLIRKKCDNLQQIQTLTKARDVLLPKLMSGKLRITE